VAVSPAGIIGALLTDRATLFGKPVRLLWPDGYPPGWTADDLHQLGERWSAAEPREPAAVGGSQP
jgi:hypothetical protein